MDAKEQYDMFCVKIDQIYDSWKDSEFLKGFPKDQAKIVAVLLDNQKLVLDQYQSRDEFKEIALQIVSKVFKDFAPFYMVPIQPMLGPAAPAYWMRFKFIGEEIKLDLTSEDKVAKTRHLKVRTEKGQFLTEGYVDKFAQQIRDDISREIINDLRNNVGTVATRNSLANYESIYCNMVEVSGIIHRKTLRGGTKWVVMSPKMASDIANMMTSPTDIETDCIKKVGTWCNAWHVIVDPQYPDDELLCGTYEPLLEGYFYMPYVLLTEMKIDDNNFGYATRYSKFLLREGSKAYAKIKLQPAELNFQI